MTTVNYEGKDYDVFLDMCNKNNRVYDIVRVISGDISQVKENGCAMPQAVLNSIGAEVGDEIIIHTDGFVYTYRIVASFAEIFTCATQYTCDMLVDSIPEELEQHTVFATYYEDDVTNSQFIERYSVNNDGIIDGFFRSQSECIIDVELTELILGGILLGISSMVFLAILIIISYIVKSSLRSDQKTIAVYKTIGYTNMRIMQIYMFFYLRIISVGAIIGGICSPILSSSFVTKVYTNVGETEAIGGGVQVVVCILVIILAAFLMLLAELSKVMHMKPVEILSDMESAKALGRVKKMNRFRFSPMAMACKMFCRDKKNTILLTITCIISILIVNLSVVCLQNINLIKGENNYYWLGIDKHDVTFENQVDFERFYEICEEVSKDAEVTSLVKRNFDMGFAIPYHGLTSAMVYETFDDVELAVLEGRLPKQPNEIFIGNVYLEELGVDIGDYMTLQLDANTRRIFSS